MSWKDKMKEFGGGDLTFLSEDGEVLMFVVVGDPVLLPGKYKGKPSNKIGCPVVTDDGYQLFVAGKRLARKISKHEAEFKTKAFMAIRHGEQNNVESYYELQILPDKEKTDKLLKFVKGKDFSVEITESVDSALAVMKG